MSKSLLQPIGQKRLTNMAVVRLKKHGNRFEIACYKNKVLSYRSAVEKDVNEVLHSYTVYSNVSKGIIAKSKDLRAAFGTDDWGKVCLEILDKGELQVAGKERESEFQSQFRDIATIVMQKTINPETQRPYTISMIERLMHDIHFAVDPKSSSKKQALEVIRELQKQFPIKRAPMQLRLIVSEENMSSLLEKLNGWDANLVSRDESGNQLICEIDPGLFRDCDALMRSLQGKLEVLAVNVHVESDTRVDDDNEHEDEPSKLDNKESTRLVAKLSNKLQSQTISASGGGTSEGEQKQLKCSTCNTYVSDLKEYRVHFKSEWHNHNIKRKSRQLSPLTADEWMADVQLGDSMDNLKDYS